jgi:pimeloyl-ACP methyl ester carboxylesterase
MFETLKKLRYGARVYLSRKGGGEETVDVHGRGITMMHGGDGPAFVYLHSTLGESNRWLPFYQAWAKHFTVYVPTHPGFHKSGGFDQIDTIEDMAFHYVELFDLLGLGEVILGGASLGGWIAAEFACRWPERVKKLWISGAPGLWVDEEPLPDLFRYLTNLEKLRELNFSDPTGYMAKLILSDNADDARKVDVYQSMTVLARLVWDRPYNPKLAARLHRVQCPTLLLWGEPDRLVPPSYGDAYRQHLPHAEMKRIKNCGHLAIFEKEAEFVHEVTSFCQS